MRDGHVCAREAERDQAGDGVLQERERHRERDVGPVEPERREAGVLHERGQRVVDRVADQAHQPGLAAEGHPQLSPPRG